MYGKVRLSFQADFFVSAFFSYITQFFS